MSDTGPRPRNEDYHCLVPELGLYAVADGMGGAAGGDVASRLAVEAVVRYYRQAQAERDIQIAAAEARTEPHGMDKAIAMACREVARASIGPLAEMGTTLAALLVLGDQVVVTHVGDSRVYRFRGDRLERLTTDHSMVAELEAALGAVTPAMRRAFGHIVTRHIGTRGPADPECKVFAGEPGDRFLICTDGVTDGLDDTEIERTFREAGTPAEACDAIVSRASDGGADDNITAVVVELS